MCWKPISGYEGYYEVSSNGEVRSIDRTVVDKKGRRKHFVGKQMKITKSSGRNNDGYYVVNLRSYGSSKVVPIHTLVATEFIPNPCRLPTVNHVDGDKSNNRACNLEWASYRDNNIHALKSGLRKPRGTAIVQKDMSGNVIAGFQSVCAASRATGIGRSLISHCVNNRINTAGGFIWEKLSEGVTTIS